jgi:hypothetical protein
MTTLRLFGSKKTIYSFAVQLNQVTRPADAEFRDKASYERQRVFMHFPLRAVAALTVS